MELILCILCSHHVSFLIFLADFFAHDLKPYRDGNLIPLPESPEVIDVDADEEEKGERSKKEFDSNMAVTELKTSGTVVMTLFHERGLWSKHCYQPVVNQRPIAVDNWNSERVEKNKDNSLVTYPPLRDSLVSLDPDGVTGFDVVTRMSLFTYGVTPTREAGLDEGLTTPMRLEFKIPSAPAPDGNEPSDPSESTPDDDDISFGSGSLFNTRAVPISASVFKRTLEVFGYRWAFRSKHGRKTVYVDHGDDDDVGVAELHRFYSLFKDDDFSTEEKFKAFLEKFRLENIYRYDPTLNLPGNIERFGLLVRALTRSRVCCYEGQHRWILIALYSCGYVGADASAPLVKRSFHDVFRDLVREKSAAIEEDPPALAKIASGDNGKSRSCM